MLTDQDIAELRKLEESLWIEETRFDRGYIDRVLAPDFVEFGRSGRIYQRDDILSTTPRKIIARLPLRDFRAEPLGEDVVLVTYMSEIQGEHMEIANRSSVWLRSDGRWRLRFHRGTPTQRTWQTQM